MTVTAKEIDRYYNELLKSKRLSSNTLKAYFGDLEDLKSFILEFGSADSDGIAKGFITYLQKRKLSAASIYRKTAAVRGFLVDLSERTGEPISLQVIKALTVDNPSNYSDRYFSEEVPTQGITALLQYAKLRKFEARPKAYMIACRDLALTYLFLETGIYAREAAALTLDDFSLDHKTVSIQGEKIRRRELSLSEDASKALLDYIKVRERSLEAHATKLELSGDPNSAAAFRCEKILFLGRFLKPIPSKGITNAVRNLCESSGLQLNVTSRTFRYNFARDLFSKGESYSEIQSKLGSTERVLSGYFKSKK